MIKIADELAIYGVPLSVCYCESSVIRYLLEVRNMIRESLLRWLRVVSLRRRFSSYPTYMLEPTINVLKRIAKERRVPVPAVSLNYSINKGVVPLDMQSLGGRLTEEEIKVIEAVSMERQISSSLQYG
ncbi:hypothetical protein N7516_010842 [Penicillium verrucosum]|uniref:uncharacterized protein n=1 Tax=Penicillium verrucosum TaxID=60171 RepID=UPI0025451611|nr:uncharacterized protein N7516_010842 [Penicillium verrucosum]KAJ5923139.1 hypothetical protein N7516_010842 [Penicillium verrucosum]